MRRETTTTPWASGRRYGAVKAVAVAARGETTRVGRGQAGQVPGGAEELL